MEHLITEKEFKDTLQYYSRMYTGLTDKEQIAPAAACVILLASTLDIALRVVFSEEDERLEDHEERIAQLEAAVKNQ